MEAKLGWEWVFPCPLSFSGGQGLYLEPCWSPRTVYGNLTNINKYLLNLQMICFLFILWIFTIGERQLELTRQESLSDQFISYCCHRDIFCFLKQPCSCWHWDNKYFDNENPLY